MSGSGFQPRSQATIRTSMLNDLQSRYASLTPPQSINIVPGSDAYFMADALAIELMLLENQAQANISNAFPDTADQDSVTHAGNLQAVQREPAVPWTGQIQVSGSPAGATLTLGTSTLMYNGIAYGGFTDTSGNPITSAPLSGGVYTLQATAQVAGANTNLPVGTILTWSSGPAGAANTAVVLSTVATGADQESLTSWALRIIAKLQERPASGNRSDWADWVGQFAGVVDEYTYPLTTGVIITNADTNTAAQAGYTTGALGCVTVLPLGPALGDTPDSGQGRVLGASVRTEIIEFIEGLADNQGNALVTGNQLYPTTIPAGNFSVIGFGVTTTNAIITLSIPAASVFAPAWTSAGPTVSAVSSLTPGLQTYILTVSSMPTGLAVGTLVAVPCTLASKRGGYDIATVMAADPIGLTVTTGPLGNALSVPNYSTSGASGPYVMLPACQGWKAIQLAVFGYFDALGPADVPTTDPNYFDSARFPGTDKKGAAVISMSSLQARALDAFPAASSATAGTGTSGAANDGFINSPSFIDINPAPFTVGTLCSLFITFALV